MGPIGDTHRSYNAARRRCDNPTSPHYAGFGGAGIKFLLPPFQEFVAILGTKPAQYRLSRIDSTKNYEIGNVEWRFDPKIPVKRLRPAWIGPHTRKTTARRQRQLVARTVLLVLSNLGTGRKLARVIGDLTLAEGINEFTLRSVLRALGVKYVTSTGAKWTKGEHEFCYWELPATPAPTVTRVGPGASVTDPAPTAPAQYPAGEGNQTAVTATPEALAERRDRLARHFSPIRVLKTKGETR